MWTIKAAAGACGTATGRSVADGVYAISNSGLATCASLLSGAACPNTATSMVAADDATGNQRFTLTYIAGTAGVRLAGIRGFGFGVPPPRAPELRRGLAPRPGRRRRQAVERLRVREAEPCGRPGQAWVRRLGRRQLKRAVLQVYDVALPCGHAQCNQFLSVNPNCGYPYTDFYYQDDQSGRQQWQVRLRRARRSCLPAAVCLASLCGSGGASAAPTPVTDRCSGATQHRQRAAPLLLPTTTQTPF